MYSSICILQISNIYLFINSLIYLIYFNNSATSLSVYLFTIQTTYLLTARIIIVFIYLVIYCLVKKRKINTNIWILIIINIRLDSLFFKQLYNFSSEKLILARFAQIRSALKGICVHTIWANKKYWCCMWLVLKTVSSSLLNFAHIFGTQDLFGPNSEVVMRKV